MARLLAWNPWRRLGDLPPAVWILAGATLINRAGTMALPFLTLYMTRELGYSAEDAGLAMTCYGLGILIVAPLSGMLSDTVGPLRVMKTSLALTAAILFAFPAVKPFPLIIGTVILWSLASEAFRPASLAILTGLVPAGSLKGAFTLNRLAVNLGMSIGPAVGGFLFLWSSVALFWVDAATSLVAALVLALMTSRIETSREGARPHSGPVARERGGLLAALSDGRLGYFLIAILPIFLVFFQHGSSMPLFLVRNLGLPESAYGIMFSVNTAMIITIEVPLNMATLHVPHRKMLPLGALLVGVGFGALMFVSTVAGFIATVMVWTVGEMILLPVSSAYIGELAPPERRGQYMGLFQMSFGLAFALSGWAGTSVLDRFGGGPLWAGTFVAGCVSAWALSRIKDS